MQQQDNNQRYIIVATLSFIVGFGLAWLITANRVPNNSGSLDSSEQLATSTISSEATSTSLNSISVKDQMAGTEVFFDQAVFQNPGWVVIHEDDNGAPGRILGAQLFDSGTWSGKVELLRGTLQDKVYYTMLHSDNGDRAFDPKKDMPIQDEGGAPIMQMFKTVQGSTSNAY